MVEGMLHKGDPVEVLDQEPSHKPRTA
jgi:hypothetical protein